MAMTSTTESSAYPTSPRVEVNGIPYFARMCDKIRSHAKGDLHADYQPNLGGGYDKWCCEYLKVDYADLVAQVNNGLSDEAALEWAVATGGARTQQETDWWVSYMKNRGNNDDLAEIFNQRKDESGYTDRADISNFFDYIDADEGRM